MTTEANLLAGKKSFSYSVPLSIQLSAGSPSNITFGVCKPPTPRVSLCIPPPLRVPALVSLYPCSVFANVLHSVTLHYTALHCVFPKMRRSRCHWPLLPLTVLPTNMYI